MNDQPLTSESTPAQRGWSRGALLVVFGIVFLAGGAIGAAISAKLIFSRINEFRQHPERLPDQVVPRLAQVLSLSDQQEARVDAIFRQRHARIVGLHGEVSGEIHRQFAQMEDEIAAELEPKQRQVWGKMASRIRDRFLPPQP